MNKKKIVAATARKTEYPIWEVNKIIDPLLETIIETLEGGDEVSLNNFGKFTLKYQKPTEKIHPKTQKRIKVPAKLSIVFKPTRMFKPTDEAVEKLSKQKRKE